MGGGQGFQHSQHPLTAPPLGPGRSGSVRPRSAPCSPRITRARQCPPLPSQRLPSSPSDTRASRSGRSLPGLPHLHAVIFRHTLRSPGRSYPANTPRPLPDTTATSSSFPDNSLSVSLIAGESVVSPGSSNRGVRVPSKSLNRPTRSARRIWEKESRLFRARGGRVIGHSCQLGMMGAHCSAG